MVTNVIARRANLFASDVSEPPIDSTLCHMKLKNARLCLECDLVMDDVRCEKCGNTMLIALYSLVNPEELRLEIAFARSLRPSPPEFPKPAKAS